MEEGVEIGIWDLQRPLMSNDCVAEARNVKKCSRWLLKLFSKESNP